MDSSIQRQTGHSGVGHHGPAWFGAILGLVAYTIEWGKAKKDSKKNLEFPFFVLKMIEYFGNSHAFFTLATKKVLNFLGFPQ